MYGIIRRLRFAIVCLVSNNAIILISTSDIYKVQEPNGFSAINTIYGSMRDGVLLQRSHYQHVYVSAWVGLIPIYLC